jgi:hypothetical protein
MALSFDKRSMLTFPYGYTFIILMLASEDVGYSDVNMVGMHSDSVVSVLLAGRQR